ncbi:hypothetical protein SZ25_00674 [Candidatus Arcanobacter lacustris]|uniref:Uncharacterized protein n=1 Tax=Candidatus Arcanibacter lacustris TaxID=1607817 RepID=A0A0F5MN94_9RICK|nr:hypothetical protein SZ25_00674 [Candidatus Arcanobacter lacustris]
MSRQKGPLYYAHFFDSMVLQNTDSDNEGSIPTTSSSNEYMQENVTAQHTIPSFPQTGNVNVAGVSINFVTADFSGPLFY